MIALRVEGSRGLSRVWVRMPGLMLIWVCAGLGGRRCATLGIASPGLFHSIFIDGDEFACGRFASAMGYLNAPKKKGKMRARRAPVH
ncbi:hypothetical protein NL676_021226 [Syzygium grande]|nr:hypothetical protein NL676_021226 [Syzygium grande]